MNGSTRAFRPAVIVALIAVNIVAHFIPFERAALAPDDYAALMRAAPYDLPTLMARSLRSPDRPLNYAVLGLQSKWAGDNPTTGLWLVVLSSTFVLLATYGLLAQWLTPMAALVGALVFCVLPNKLETYHTPIFMNINLAIGLYILSLSAYVRYASGRGWGWLAFSLLTYGVVLFWYEVGFFLPLVMWVYGRLFHRDRARAAWLFTLPAALYAAYRLTGAFGLVADVQPAADRIALTSVPISLLDLLHHYAGRYMIRSILYGVYNFVAMDRMVLAAAVVLDLLIIALLWRWLRLGTGRPETRLLAVAGVLWTVTLAPIVLHSVGGIGGRHLVLPSIGVALALLWLAQRTGMFGRAALAAVFVGSLVICQGNAWTQVVASRLNAAVYAAIKQDREALRRAERVIVDTRSFADRIPFTWVQRDFNVLNTYYGAQAFEDWGLRSMVKLATGDPDKPVFVATERVRESADEMLEFGVVSGQGYRAVSPRRETVPKQGTVVIDFQRVFGDRFRYGRRPQTTG